MEAAIAGVIAFTLTVNFGYMGIAVSVVLGLTIVWLTAQRERILRTTERYLEISKANPDLPPMRCLIEAGGLLLRNRWEAAAVFQRVKKFGSASPNNHPKNLSDKEVLKFLQSCEQKGHALRTEGEVILAITEFRSGRS
jgi:hypothetical protein